MRERRGGGEREPRVKTTLGVQRVGGEGVKERKMEGDREGRKKGAWKGGRKGKEEKRRKSRKMKKKCEERDVEYH